MCLHYIKYEKLTSSAKGLFKILGEIWPEYLAVPSGPEEQYRGASLCSSQHFSYSWARAVSDNCAFLHLAPSLPRDFGTVRVKGVWSKNTPILQGGEKKGSVCLQLTPPSGSLNKPAFPKMSGCWNDFFLLKLFLLSLGEEHMEKFIRKLKLRK